MDSILLAVTPGDPDGIGPEIVWKTLLKRAHGEVRWERADLLCIGARAPFDRLGAPVLETSLSELRDRRFSVRRRGKTREPYVWLLPAPESLPKGHFSLPGYQSGWSIETATRLLRSGQASALVTGPISKERLQQGGYPYAGHTEFLAKLCKVRTVTMMLANELLRVSLVTTHLALKNVPRAITRTAVERAVLHTADHLRRWWGIRRPKIAVAALNPHAGEGGLFGDEEVKVIRPAIKHLAKRVQLFGPLPADTLFARHAMASKSDRFDAVVCMYHDQGLIPVKLLDFPKTVNITLGLPIVRTSVDHGVGFDIAGKGVADPSSFQSAVQMAFDIARNQK